MIDYKEELAYIGIVFLVIMLGFFVTWVAYLINPHSCHFMGC